MTEQYIYSRSDSRFENGQDRVVGLGFGFVAGSPGLTNGMRKEARLHCESAPEVTQTDSTGRPMMLLRKARSARLHKVVVQGTSWIWDENGGRPFHVAHGYLLDEAEADSVNPMKWFALPFYTENPNDTPGGVLLDSLEDLSSYNYMPQADWMAAGAAALFGLEKMQFYRLLLACLEALASHRQVLIACDYSDPEVAEKQKALLFWLCFCLPYSARRDIGIDNLYTMVSAPRYIQLAFVDVNNLQMNGQQVGIQMESSVLPLRDNFLAVEGRILHGKNPGSWFSSDCFFARWLRQVVDALWQAETMSQALPVLGALRQVYERMDSRVLAEDAPTGPDATALSALCWLEVNSGAGAALAAWNERALASLDESEEDSFRNWLLRYGDESLQAALARGALERILRGHTVPAAETDLDALVALLNGDAGEVAGYILSGFMAADLTAKGVETAGSCAAVLARYKEKMPDALYAHALRCALTGGASEDEARVWSGCGAAADVAACAARFRLWYNEKLADCGGIAALPGCIQRALDELPGLDDRQRGILAEQMARDVLSGRMEEMEPSPAVEDVLAFVKAVTPQLGTPVGEVYAAMARDLADRCTADPLERGEDPLVALETIRRAMEPAAAQNRKLVDCWSRLFEKQFSALTGQPITFAMDERLTTRIRDLNVAGGPDVSPWVESLLAAVYGTLLGDPKPFMSGAWLQKELQDRPLHTETEQALKLLADFASQEVQSGKVWEQVSSRPGWESARDLARRALPGMFLTGNLPRVAGAFVMFCMRCRPDWIGRIVRQAAEQGGAELLTQTMEQLKKYRRLLEADGTSAVLTAVQAIAAEPSILDKAMGQGGRSLEFDGYMLNLLTELSREGAIPQSEAERIGAVVKEHQTSHGGGNPFGRIRKWN